MNFQKLFQNWEEVQEHKAGDVIFSAGDDVECLYFVLDGEVELKLHGETLGTESAGGVFGELAMLDSPVQTANAVAVSDVKLARVDRKNLKNITRGNNAFSIHVMAALARRLKTVNEYISERLKPGKH